MSPKICRTPTPTTTKTCNHDKGNTEKPQSKLVSPLDKPLPKSNPSFSRPDGKEGMPDGKGGFRHGGLDWFAKAGTNVRAPVDGKVIEVKQSKGSSGQVFGGTVKVEGKDGKVWVFRHVDPAKVKVGQKVQAGDTIAKVSDWKGTSSDHVHMEVWKNLKGGYNFNNAIDPVKALQGASRDVNGTTTSGPGPSKPSTTSSTSPNSASGTRPGSPLGCVGISLNKSPYAPDGFDAGSNSGNVVASSGDGFDAVDFSMNGSANGANVNGASVNGNASISDLFDSGCFPNQGGTSIPGTPPSKPDVSHTGCIPQKDDVTRPADTSTGSMSGTIMTFMWRWDHVAQA
ncbi:putative peptidase [Myxococcus stipitatus DSM 14675]|uniref:Putative peptidase n=1 Tax=Myxococcus stipitatus (strain DSM 14675 / JCM 12634 / Mx s8) TaxID=1278073 RepID=L7U4M1_MYXSD|nr:M23 family metallopeptidase [Myxococcus stipitatus]AGC43108.1 putative peptidase [Myxococcus stipitatus DSM 14675]